MELKDITKPAVVISSEATFKDALALMISKQTNSLMVSGEDGILVGEVGVSDLLDAIVPEHLDGDSITEAFAKEEMFEEAVQNAANRMVSEFMSSDIEPVKTDDGLMAVAANAIAQRRAQIPVVDEDGRPAGVISRRGLKHILASSLGIKDS